jgi:diguanylate cyclase (GGDEF)-like protein
MEKAKLSTPIMKNILIIDDNQEDIVTYKRFLQKSEDYTFLISEADSGARGLELFEQNAFDCILLDYRLPDMDGLVLIEKIAPKGKPVVFITGHGNENIAVEAMKKGATDYLIKNQINDDNLIRSIRYSINQKTMQQQLEIMANTDMLTGIYNRRAGLLILESQMKQTRRDSTPLTICFVDVNNLEYINDKFGHAEGDEAIKAVSKSIAQVLRASDILCRLGGDEMLAVLPKCNKEQAQQMGKRISNIFDLYNKKNGKPYAISASFGFAEYQRDSDIALDEFISIADKEMYQNKQAFKKADNKI